MQCNTRLSHNASGSLKPTAKSLNPGQTVSVASHAMTLLTCSHSCSEELFALGRLRRSSCRGMRPQVTKLTEPRHTLLLKIVVPMFGLPLGGNSRPAVQRFLGCETTIEHVSASWALFRISLIPLQFMSMHGYAYDADAGIGHDDDDVCVTRVMMMTMMMTMLIFVLRCVMAIDNDSCRWCRLVALDGILFWYGLLVPSHCNYLLCRRRHKSLLIPERSPSRLSSEARRYHRHHHRHTVSCASFFLSFLGCSCQVLGE